MIQRRVQHKIYGRGKVIEHSYVGLIPVTLVKFDSQKEEILVENSELEIEVIMPKISNDKDKKEELDNIRAESLEELDEISSMNNESLLEGFEYIVRNGAGPTVRKIIFMKREILRRMR